VVNWEEIRDCFDLPVLAWVRPFLPKGSEGHSKQGRLLGKYGRWQYALRVTSDMHKSKEGSQMYKDAVTGNHAHAIRCVCTSCDGILPRNAEGDKVHRRVAC
jgi:hypothetical protein